MPGCHAFIASCSVTVWYMAELCWSRATSAERFGGGYRIGDRSRRMIWTITATSHGLSGWTRSVMIACLDRLDGVARTENKKMLLQLIYGMREDGKLRVVE